MQDELERALAVVLRLDAVPVTVAGRTDAGVHAWRQVASYSGNVAPVEGINALLPEDVAVLECAAGPPDFDARRDATSRAYCYRVLARRARSAVERGRALHWPGRVDVSLLDECAAALVGTHDFTAFTPAETEHVRFSRDVYAAFWQTGVPRPPVRDAPDAIGARGASDFPGASDVLEFWIEADAFLRHMNRVLVGTMLEVAAGRRSVGDFVALLSGRGRSQAGLTAPAHGLYLAGVGYRGERVLGV